MLTIAIAGKLAMPIRAIPYCSHGFLNASAVAAFLANPNSIGGEFDAQTCDDPDHPLTRYKHPPHPFRIDAHGRVEQIHPGVFHSVPQQVETATSTGHSIDAVRALPPGVFVWLKDVQELFNFLDFQFERQECNALGDVQNFRYWLDLPFVNLDPETTEMILEGVALAAHSTVKRTVKRSGPGDTDPVTQVEADKVDDIFRKTHGRIPKKKEVASILVKNSGRLYGTIMREIQSPKTRK